MLLSFLEKASNIPMINNGQNSIICFRSFLAPTALDVHATVALPAAMPMELLDTCHPQPCPELAASFIQCMI